MTDAHTTPLENSEMADAATPARTCPLQGFKSRLFRWTATGAENVRRRPLLALSAIASATVVGATHWLGFTCPYFGATILGGYCCWAAVAD